MFHSKDGLCFERLPGGSVAVVLQVPVTDMLNTVTGFAQVQRVELDPETWASVVASVSLRGEDSASFNAALLFHSER